VSGGGKRFEIFIAGGFLSLSLFGLFQTEVDMTMTKQGKRRIPAIPSWYTESGRAPRMPFGGL